MHLALPPLLYLLHRGAVCLCAPSLIPVVLLYRFEVTSHVSILLFTDLWHSQVESCRSWPKKITPSMPFFLGPGLNFWEVLCVFEVRTVKNLHYHRVGNVNTTNNLIVYYHYSIKFVLTNQHSRADYSRQNHVHRLWEVSCNGNCLRTFQCCGGRRGSQHQGRLFDPISFAVWELFWGTV